MEPLKLNKVVGAQTNSLANLVYFWSAYGLVVCMTSLADWLRHDRNKINK